MKTCLALAIALVAGGCCTFSTKPKWPVAPDIKSTCPELALVPLGTEKLSETLNVITKNYGEYHECKARVEAWNAWYAEQKKIYEAAK